MFDLFLLPGMKRLEGTKGKDLLHSIGFEPKTFGLKTVAYRWLECMEIFDKRSHPQ